MLPINSTDLSVTNFPKSETSQTFELKMELASKQPNVATKREDYNAIFKTLCNNVQTPQLFKLFEAYATSTCYNQVIDNDSEEGFRRSAKLMLFSLNLQLKLKEIPSWTKFDSIDDLISSDNLVSVKDLLTLDKDVLHQAAHADGITDIVAETLTRLAFSYQNIAAYKCPSEDNIILHKKLNELTEPLLQIKSEFAYNRRPFIVRLEKPGDKDALIKAYQELVPLFKEELSDFEYQRKFAQVHNICALTLAGDVLRSINGGVMLAFVKNIKNSNTQNPLPQEFFSLTEEDQVETLIKIKIVLEFLQNIKNTNIQVILDQALNHFIEADKIHVELLMQATPEKFSSQKFLTANAKSSLVVSLLIENRLEEAEEHVKYLKDYLRRLDMDSDYNSYAPGYKRVVDLYDEVNSTK